MSLPDYPRPPFKPQQQSFPGKTALMDPKPDHGEDSYVGSGQLAGKKALITGGDSGIGAAVAIGDTPNQGRLRQETGTLVPRRLGRGRRRGGGVRVAPGTIPVAGVTAGLRSTARGRYRRLRTGLVGLGCGLGRGEDALPRGRTAARARRIDLRTGTAVAAGGHSQDQ